MAALHSLSADTPRSVAAALRALDGVTGSHPQWAARCPAHDDSSPSLSVTVGDDGLPAFFCHGGCEPWAIRPALLARGVPDKDLRPANRPKDAPTNGQRPAQPRHSAPADDDKPPAPLRPTPRLPAPQEVEDWQYALTGAREAWLREERGLTDATIGHAEIGWDGQRYSFPIRDAAGRLVNVRRYRPGADNKWVNCAGAGHARLYAPKGGDLPPAVLLCAGELDMWLAWQHGYNACTFTGGEGKVPDATELERLRGRTVVLAYDADAAGSKGAVKAGAALSGIARSVRLADLTSLEGLPESGDVTDVLVNPELGPAALMRVVTAAQPYSGTTAEVVGDGEEEDDVLRAIKALFVQDAQNDSASYFSQAKYDEDVLAMEDPQFAVEDWIPLGVITVFWGRPGAYKTFLLHEVMRSVRRGLPWQHNDVKRGMAVMFQGEGLEQLKPRIRAWDALYPLGKGETMAPGAYFSVQPNICVPEGVAAIARTVRDLEAHHGQSVVLVGLDPLVEFVPYNDKVESTDLASRGLRALAIYLGCAVVVGHHANAEGARSRGTDHLNMRAGAHIEMEVLGSLDNLDGAVRVGVLQHKQKNRAKLGMVLRVEEVEDSVVLMHEQTMLQYDYLGLKAGAQKARKTKTEAMKEAHLHGDLYRKILAALQHFYHEEKKVVSQTKIYSEVGGNRTAFKKVLVAMQEERVLDVEEQGPGKASLVSLAEEWLTKQGIS